MDNKIKEFAASLTDEQREKMMAILENKPKSKAWKPAIGESFWCVDSWGGVIPTTWENSLSDNWRYNSGNCFRTKEEAEFYKEKLLVTAELQRFADEHNDEMETMSFIVYERDFDRLEVTRWTNTKIAPICFSSIEIAKQAIETIGEERIKKYYLGVEV